MVKVLIYKYFFVFLQAYEYPKKREQLHIQIVLRKVYLT